MPRGVLQGVPAAGCATVPGTVCQCLHTACAMLAQMWGEDSCGLGSLFVTG